MAVLSKIWGGIRWFFGLLLPIFSKATDYRGWSSGTKWFFHFLMLAVVLVVLAFINHAFDLEKVLRAPSPILRKLWLPLLFVLVYILSWLGFWLWKLLGAEDEGADFPDIDAAWAEINTSLNQAGVALVDAPLFLVLGRSAGGEEALFTAAALQLMVKQAPREPGAPMHAYANREGIYITCTGASLLARQASILTGELDAAVERGPEPAPGADDSGNVSEDMFKSIGPAAMRGGANKAAGLLGQARIEGRALTGSEKRRIRREANLPVAQLLPDKPQVDRLIARLRYLCRLILRDRRPFCPINGIMVLVPLAATDSEEDSKDTATVCQLELTAVKEVLRVNCPVVALVADLEQAIGFKEFIERFPEGQKQRRVGQRFPLVPDVEMQQIPNLVDGGTQFVCNVLFPTWVYKLFRTEAPGGKEDAATATRGNIQLYRLMSQMRDRPKRLARILTRGLGMESGQMALFGGCYVGGTGRNAAKEQAFVAGVFRRLIENQNFVSWTNDAWNEEADYARWTNYGYIGLTILGLALAGLAYVFMTRQ